MLPKNLQLTIAWIVLASLFVVTAFWQAQSAVAREARARHQTLPPPVKTRHAVRPAVQPWSGDVVADYVARCGKGMTDREIGWIVEDFQAAGLDQVNFTDQTPDADFLAYRAAQQRWYHGALVDGLRLSPEQSRQAAAKLRELMQATVTRFLRDREKAKPDHFDAHPQARVDLILCHQWLWGAESENPASDLRFLPRALCPLTRQQGQISPKEEIIISAQASVSDADKNPAEPQKPAEEDDNLKKRHLTDDPFDDEKIPERFHLAGLLFPFLDSQKFVVRDDLSDQPGEANLINFRRLHPAQLKMLLLFYPDMAAEIRLALTTEAR